MFWSSTEFSEFFLVFDVVIFVVLTFSLKFILFSMHRICSNVENIKKNHSKSDIAIFRCSLIMWIEHVNAKQFNFKLCNSKYFQGWIVLNLFSIGNRSNSLLLQLSVISQHDVIILHKRLLCIVQWILLSVITVMWSVS